MQVLSIIFAIICATAALARPSALQFNEAMREDLQKDIKQDADKYKKVTRGPASVEPVQPEVLLDETKALDKVEKQHKQLGNKSW